MTMRKWMVNGLFVLTVVSCLSILGCNKKGHCAECTNDSDCDSKDCETFIVSSSGQKFLACSDGSSNDTCTAPK
ncbi:MAG TPA: hypothetical protein VIW45_00115 [Vicinamibacterales bacterium]